MDDFCKNPILEDRLALCLAFGRLDLTPRRLQLSLRSQAGLFASVEMSCGVPHKQAVRRTHNTQMTGFSNLIRPAGVARQTQHRTCFPPFELFLFSMSPSAWRRNADLTTTLTCSTMPHIDLTWCNKLMQATLNRMRHHAI